MMQIGLITEGKTDQIVCQAFLASAIDHLSENNFTNVQPTADRTSAGYDQDGGWHMVYKWSLSHTPALRKQMLNGGLFQTSPSYDAIIIHLDADLCEKTEFQQQSNLDVNDFILTTPEGRGDYIEAVLTDWLWPHVTETDDRNWMILAPAVEAIETWLVAGLTDEKRPESLPSPALTLLAWDHRKRKQPLPSNAKTIKKSVKRYKRFTQQATQNIDNVITRCPYFARLVTRLKQLPTYSLDSPGISYPR